VPSHRATARLIILDGDRSVLLVRYAEHRSGRSGSYWATPGGALEPGESAHEAAARELHEETGLRS
jgi:8-oxo-dGTP pyrophosphatase MutT (NUDIX family)